MTVYAFDATVSSHHLLKAGITEARLPGSPHRHHRVLVEADSRDEAALIAAQMVSCQWICTGITTGSRTRKRSPARAGAQAGP